VLEDLRRQYQDDHSKRYFLVTEVTHMKTGDVCVAAIDVQRLLIVRPLQWNHHNWPREMASTGLEPGRMVCQQIRAQQDAQGYPHETEDTQLRDNLEITGRLLQEPELFETLAPVVDSSISAIFDDKVIDNKYVVDGTECRSLGAVLLDPGDVAFRQNNYSKWRLGFSDGFKAYDLPVTDLRVYNAVERGQALLVTGAITGAARHQKKILARVGLARGWAGPNRRYNPERCYLQVNGLIFAASPGF
jgi:hypothetical protein